MVGPEGTCIIRKLNHDKRGHKTVWEALTSILFAATDQIKKNMKIIPFPVRPLVCKVEQFVTKVAVFEYNLIHGNLCMNSCSVHSSKTL